MKNIRIIFIILTIIWMILVFMFSNQPAEQSQNTSSYVVKTIVNIIYGDRLSDDEKEEKIEEMQPIIRKLAHYTLYTVGGILIFAVIFTYKKILFKKIIIAQIIGSLYAMTDEVHQYFIMREKL